MNNDNPVGSVNEREYYDLYGSAGGFRHAGYFSQDNPYLKSMRVAPTNKDQDALFERAMEWEANRQTLLEQREYDDPSNVVARQRAAGINPDLEGASSSGLSSAGSSAQQQPIQAYSHYKNAYDDTAEVLNGINTGVNILSSVTGFATSAFDLYKGISTLGDALSLSSASVQLANNAVLLGNEQIAGQQLQNTGQGLINDAQGIQNTGLRLQNANQALSTIVGGFDFISQILPAFGADAKNEEIISTLSSLGLPNAESYLPIVSKVRESPEFASKLADISKHYKQSKAENDALAYDMYYEQLTNDNKATLYRSRSNVYISRFEEAVNSAFLSASNAQKQATVLDTELSSAVISSDLVNSQLKADFDAFGEQLAYQQKQLNDANSDVKTAQENYDKHSTPANYARLISAKNHFANIKGLMSQDLIRLYGMVEHWNVQSLGYEEFIGKDGYPTVYTGTFKGRYVDYINFLVDNHYNAENGTFDFSSLTALVAGAATAYVTRGKSAGAQFKGFTVSTTK